MMITGKHIIKQPGRKSGKILMVEITHFVSAMGTTGTIIGVSSFLKEQNKNVQIVGAQPTDNSKIPGIRKWPVGILTKNIRFRKSRSDN